LYFRSRSAHETQEAGRKLGECIDDRGLVIGLVGPLGAGKTVFVRGLAEGLGIDPSLVASPTFVIASEYPGKRPLAHVDLYRVESVLELEAAGFLDLLVPGAVVAIEWADRLPAALPADLLEVKIRRMGPAPQNPEPLREIEVLMLGSVAEDAGERWARRLSR
jgi:tRNA threonylcarbamoyladenosine biosynthesis protein TsaE